MPSICNNLLSGHREEALNHLKRTSMDNGVACESVHEETGVCVTGGGVQQQGSRAELEELADYCRHYNLNFPMHYEYVAAL